MSFSELSANKRKSVLLRWVRKAVGKFGMLEEWDHVILAVSGGIDSLTMLDLMTERSPWWANHIEVTAANVDAGFEHSGENIEALRKFCDRREMDLRIIERPEISRIALGEDRPQNPCFICSRMRRKALLELADEIGANKIALAHHREDVLETFLINIFFGRQIGTMMPNQELFSGKFHLIRPLYLIEERKIKLYAKVMAFQDLSADCPVESTSRRIYVRRLLERIEKDIPGTKNNLFRAMFHTNVDYLLDRYSD